MRELLAETSWKAEHEHDRESLQRLHADLLAAFPELPAGVVLGAVARARRDLSRLGHCEGLWEAVEIVARRRLVESAALRRS